MKRMLSVLLCVIMLLSVLPSAGFAAEADDIFSEVVSVLDRKSEALLSSLYEADVVTLREAITMGLVSCEELTAYYLERIAAYDDPYNCFITICDDALEIARQRDKQLAAGETAGTLFGIPVVIKDNMDLAGYHTTNGHKKSDSQIADSNADIVDYLLSEGAVIIAKANMSTDAQSARQSLSAAGETKNAYSRYMSAGGSSGGSAVSVSLNFAVASLGTDTNSSLRAPAALSGCVSLRPTFGLISREGCEILNSTRDTPGAITRTVYDQAIMLDVLTNGVYQYAENLNTDRLEGLRIGIVQELSYEASKTGLRSGANIDSEVSAAFENAVNELCACGEVVIAVSMPNIFTLSDATMSSNSSAKKEVLYEAFQTLLEENDIEAVIYPTYLSTPLRSGRDENGTYWNVWDQTFINNCSILAPSASVPDITVPIGVHSLGAGIGMQITSSRNNEQLLLDIAASYTSQYDHRILPEGAPDTYATQHTASLRQIIDAFNALPEAEPTVPETTAPAITEQTQPVTQPVPESVKEESPVPIEIYWAIGVLALLLAALIVCVTILRRRKKAPV